MSKTDEALKREDEEGRSVANTQRVVITRQDGESFGSAIPRGSQLEHPGIFSEYLSSTPSPQLPDKHVSPNGFRRVALPAREESRLVVLTDPLGLAAEQFRLVRQILRREFATGGVLLITSPAMGDGKSLASLNLSACLANASNPTLLVELDLRRPTIRKILESAVEPRLRSVVQGYFNYHAVPGNMAPGLEDALAGSVEPAETIQWIKETNLYTALVAKTPQNPFDLISGDGIGYFMRWARERFVWVVLDAPPVLPAADVPGLLPFVDAVLLVIRAHSTPRELSKSAIEILGKRLRGVIFNEVTVHSKPNFRYLADYR